MTKSNEESYGFEKLHDKLVEIALEIDRICKKYDICYFLVDGSALGAVRHQGFIPWDDDFDIGMKVDDYIKFKKVAPKEFKDTKYFYQDIDSEEEYNLPFAKVRDSSTANISEQHSDRRINHGIWIDIFPIYSYSEVKWRQRLQQNLDSVVYVAWSGDDKCGAKKYSFVQRLVAVFGKKRLIKMLQYITRRLFLTSKSRRVVLGRREIVPRVCFDDVKMVKFEDCMFPIPQSYDMYLKAVYGDYMKCPTEEQKRAAIHKPLILDTEKSYLEYIKNE